MFGFSSIDPFNKYEVGSILEGKEELRVKKIISSKSKNRTDEYAALITLDKEISVEEANDFFSGFIVADLEVFSSFVRVYNSKEYISDLHTYKIGRESRSLSFNNYHPKI
jgi:NAD+--asparagine ADP-ribosyltransferase